MLRDRLERRLLGSVEEVGVLSEYMREQLRARYDPKAPTTVIPGGVDTEVFTPDAAREDVFDSDGPALLTVRRLSPRMGHGLLLDAFATVREQLPDAHLYIAGDGPLADRLRRRAVELGVDDATTFMGYVPDEDLPAAYASADLFVLPTRDLEGFGLATLEAFASGTPVVGTPVGGTVDLVGDFQECVDVPLDMLLSSEDADALASRLVDWLTLDPSTRRRAGEACHAHANDRYAWERIVDALERRYHAVASGEDSRSRGPEQSLVDS